MFEDFLNLFLGNDAFVRGITAFFVLWPIWVPAILLNLAFRYWLNYKTREWIQGQGSVLLEIKLPNELVKSPALMEVFLHMLYQTGVGSLTDVFFKGRVRPWFSLELVSDGGQVHFYIWMHAKWKKLVESQLYAQFPNVEVYEVPDYALAIPYDREKYKFSKMAHMILVKPDAYPIKTYIDYGLDEDPDEEFKNDPLSQVIEFLGSLKPGEHAWIQILIRAHTKEGLKYTRVVTKPDWQGGVKAEIKKIIEKEAHIKPEKDQGQRFTNLSDIQKDTIKAIERNASKFAFDSMIRVAYFSLQEVNNPNNIGGLLGSFKSFGSGNLNGFKPGFVADYDYPWQDFNDLRRIKNEKKMLEAYKRRAIFETPFRHFENKPYILSVEEVATLFHFPSSMVAATPTLSRIPSKKAAAPHNLPV
jgi:hypothetical protein